MQPFTINVHISAYPEHSIGLHAAGRARVQHHARQNINEIFMVAVAGVAAAAAPSSEGVESTWLFRRC